MSVTAETLALQAQLDAEVAAVTDAQAQLLLAAWVVAWSEVSAELEETLTGVLDAGGQVAASTLSASTRLLAALEDIQDQLADLADRAGVIITTDLASVVDRAAEAQDAVIASQLPLGVDVGLIRHEPRRDRDHPEADALAAIVERTTEQIESRLDPLPAETADIVRRELIRGVVVGANPRETARRMVDRAQSEFNGGLTRAMAIARTETLDAHRAAARIGQARNARVLVGWEWDCALSERTCPACLVMDGQFFPLEQPGPEGHVNCRCSRRPKVKPWSALGLDIPEPAPIRDDARTWFEGLSDAEKTAILGPGRLALLNAGDIAWSDLARLVPNDDWRPSWQVTPLRDLERQARGRRSRTA